MPARCAQLIVKCSKFDTGSIATLLRSVIVQPHFDLKISPQVKAWLESGLLCITGITLAPEKRTEEIQNRQFLFFGVYPEHICSIQDKIPRGSIRLTLDSRQGRAVWCAMIRPLAGCPEPTPPAGEGLSNNFPVCSLLPGQDNQMIRELDQQLDWRKRIKCRKHRG